MAFLCQVGIINVIWHFLNFFMCIANYIFSIREAIFLLFNMQNREMAFFARLAPEMPFGIFRIFQYAKTIWKEDTPFFKIIIQKNNVWSLLFAHLIDYHRFLWVKTMEIR